MGISSNRYKFNYVDCAATFHLGLCESIKIANFPGRFATNWILLAADSDGVVVDVVADAIVVVVAVISSRSVLS